MIQPARDPDLCRRGDRPGPPGIALTPEPDRAHHDALAQVGPRRTPPDGLRLLVDRRRRGHSGGDRGRIAREGTQRVGRRNHALLGELQHRLVEHPRLAEPVPEDEADGEHRRQEDHG